MKRFILLSLTGALTLPATHAQTTPTASRTHLPAHHMNNTEKVVALLKSIETGDTAPIAYINPAHYTQHNLGAADGLAGFGALLQALPKGSAAARTVRVFQDGDYVVAHTAYNFFGPKIGFDVFRFENGLIVEHWDNLQETPTQPNPSGRTMLDGPTEIRELDKTAANKALVRSFLDDVLVNGRMAKLQSYFNGDHYRQHNPTIGDGVSGLGKALGEWARQGITLKYDRIRLVLGSGNFVLAASEGTLAGKPTVFYDLFRVENGKIAEHWDTIETVPARAAWKNQNGKF